MSEYKPELTWGHININVRSLDRPRVDPDGTLIELIQIHIEQWPRARP